MIRECLVKLSQRQSLSEEESYLCMLEILEAKASPAQIAAYLTFLNCKVETTDEVVGSVKAMREKMMRINAEGLEAIDVCGTGGDHHGTFNISTTAALILAGGGVRVAKHGNRAASSQCGSAEVLESVGVRIDPSTSVSEKCLHEAGIAFLFAPHYHPAMKNVGSLRKELGFRTLFNILGPMCNPAMVKRQVVGVFDLEKAKLIAEVLVKTGSDRVVTLHSQEGMDEISCAESTTLYECLKGQDGRMEMKETKINPEFFGFNRHSLSEIKGMDVAANAKIVMEILEGRKGPCREVSIMNAAVGFYVAGKCLTIQEGIGLAQDSIDSGNALRALNTLKLISSQ